MRLLLFFVGIFPSFFVIIVLSMIKERGEESK